MFDVKLSEKYYQVYDALTPEEQVNECFVAEKLLSIMTREEREQLTKNIIKILKMTPEEREELDRAIEEHEKTRLS